MTLSAAPALNYDERLATFSDYWLDNEATARQLAAIGHVYDRPPLEALEEGSRCISCSAFVKRDLSIRTLEGPLSHVQAIDGHGGDLASSVFHLARCDWLQVRIPLEMTSSPEDAHSGSRIKELKLRFEQQQRPCAESTTSESPARATHGLFSLPVELRLEIYSMILPALPPTTIITPLNKDSTRVITDLGLARHAPRDPTPCHLLATCRAIHAEALDLLFRHRTFQFHSAVTNHSKYTAAKSLYLFLRNIGGAGRARLHAVDVHLGAREDAVAFALLASCVRLRKVVVRHARPHLLMPYAPVWYVQGIAALLSVRGLGEVEFAQPVGMAAMGSRVVATWFRVGAPEFTDTAKWLRADNPDAVVLARELRKDRKERTSVRWVDGRWIDL